MELEPFSLTGTVEWTPGSEAATISLRVGTLQLIHTSFLDLSDVRKGDRITIRGSRYFKGCIGFFHATSFEVRR